jgi:TolB-like protein/Flp pilus assembly protein TadD
MTLRAHFWDDTHAFPDCCSNGYIGMNQDSTNQTTAVREVFVSYASQDAAIAQKVCSSLETAGIRCWIAPRDVVPGTLYAEGIVHALDDSKILVLVLSKESIASAHVGRELERAASKRHPVIALKVDDAPLTAAFEYYLNESQWVELGGGGEHPAIARLVEAVAQHLAPGSAAASKAPQTPAPRSFKSRRAWGVAAAVVVLALAAGTLLVGKAWLPKHEAAAVVADKSIAVLPFTDMSEKKDQEYFADGMAEEIIDLLVKIPGLKVISRTSSFQFKGKTEDLRSIGTQLGVAYVLEGSVRKSGDHLRVTAQLIDSRNGTHLFSQTYDRDLKDVLRMQDEIAAQVGRALQIEVSAAYDMVPRPALGNTEAYTLYLQGLHALDRFDQPGLQQAENDFQRALGLDPSFAAASNRLGQVYSYLGEFGFISPTVAIEQVRHYVELTLKLDPNRAETHAALGGVIHGGYDWDWAAADRELKQARDLAPNDAAVLALSARQSIIMGRWDDALKLLNACAELDPLNAGRYLFLTFVQLQRGQLVEAEAAARRALEIGPTFTLAHYWLGIVLLVRHQPEAALTEMLKEANDAPRMGGSSMAYFAMTRKADSDAALAQMLSTEAPHPYLIAQVYAFRGESDEAFKWLDRAYSQRDPSLVFVKSQPMFRHLVSDPRYKAFLKKMNLPE